MSNAFPDSVEAFTKALQEAAEAFSDVRPGVPHPRALDVLDALADARRTLERDHGPAWVGVLKGSNIDARHFERKLNAVERLLDEAASGADEHLGFVDTRKVVDALSDYADKLARDRDAEPSAPRL